MKKQLVVTAMAVCLSIAGLAQTKGTSALSFGVNSTTDKNTGPNNGSTNKNNNFTIGYGYFFKDNSKIGLDLNYGNNKRSYENAGEENFRSYGGNLSYQKYFPIVKTLFAYAGGKAAYSYGKQDANPAVSNSELTSNQYSVGAYGGITWFLSKRFAFETSLLSADVAYSTSKQIQQVQAIPNEYKRTSFNLNSQGFINNLGFKIYILF